MTETIALHGEKPLLIEARKLLIEEGFVDDKNWNDNRENYAFTSYLFVYDNGVIALHSYPFGEVKVIKLNSKNLHKVIKSLKNKTENKRSTYLIYALVIAIAIGLLTLILKYPIPVFKTLASLVLGLFTMSVLSVVEHIDNNQNL